MAANSRGWTTAAVTRRYGLSILLMTALVGGAAVCLRAAAGGPLGIQGWHGRHMGVRECPSSDCPFCKGIAGNWYWLRSPDEEKRAVAALYNRYCIRCHGVDGRGVWDIPDVPNFTNPRWQACRSDDQLARIIIEGRGAVMPPFRGTLSLEEACAMARYLRTFVPGTELPRPAAEAGSEAPGKTKAAASPSAVTPPVPKP
jgi:mono/diheme cytochrome c family protein